MVSRQLIELATWYKHVYNNNILGLTTVWDTLISVLCKTDEDGLDLGFSEYYTVAMPAFLAPTAPLRNFKFKTDSSHTTTIGMDCVASNELLYALINTLKCTFATTANTEDIFSDEPAEFESIPSKKTVHMFGGSNMRKLVPKLEKHNFAVIDHTMPGWVPTPGNLAKLSEKIETAEPSDYVIADLLGNVTHRYTQADGTLAMPYKVDHKYHFDGEITVCTLSNLKSIVENLKPSLLKCRCHLVLTPPLPRHLHDSCCNSAEHCTNVGSENHAESMLGKLDSIRTALVSNLELIGQKDFSVPDWIKLSMPACTSRSEYAAALKTHMSSDGVHFSESGYDCLTTGLISHIKDAALSKNQKPTPAGFSTLSGAKRSGKQSFYWRGFVSPIGTGRPTNHKAAYKQSHSNPAAGRGSGAGGKWQASNTSIHNRTPYGGGKRKK
jgi:hypothetical protein